MPSRSAIQFPLTLPVQSDFRHLVMPSKQDGNIIIIQKTSSHTIYFYAKAVDVAKPSHPGAYVTDVAVFLSKRYDQTGKEDDRIKAKEHFLWAIELSQGHPLIPVMISNAGDFIRRTTKREDVLRVNHLTEAFQLQEQAILALRPNLPLPYGTIYRNAVITYHDYFHITHEKFASDKAIMYFKKALQESPPGSTGYELAQNELVEHYMLRYQAWSRPADIADAVVIYDEQLRRKPDTYLALAGKAECLRIKARGTTNNSSAREMFQTAGELMKSAIDAMPSDSSSRGWLFFRSSALYYGWFEVTGNLLHLKSAVEQAKESTHYAEHPSFWDFNRWYAETLLLRYTHLRRAQDLEDAFAAINVAIEHVPEWETENLATCTWIHGKCLRAKYDMEREVEVLNEAITYFVAACHGHMDERNMSTSRVLVQNDLGNAYCQKFQHSHSIDDLNQAIEAYQYGFKELARINLDRRHPDWFMLAAGIGYAMLQRFLFWGSEDDITAAITHYRMAISVVDTKHSRYAMRVTNLSYALQQKFTIDHELSHLVEAQKLLEKALSRLPVESVGLRRSLNIQMGNAYLYLFIYGTEKREEELDLAAEYYEVAMDAKDEADTGAVIIAMNIAMVWRKRAEHTGKLEDFVTSLNAFDKAIGLRQSQDTGLWLCS
jgi:tetratricopeptide (TPR) repeat protein